MVQVFARRRAKCVRMVAMVQVFTHGRAKCVKKNENEDVFENASFFTLLVTIHNPPLYNRIWFEFIPDPKPIIGGLSLIYIQIPTIVPWQQ